MATAADLLIPVVSLEIGGRVRHLKFDFEGMKRLETLTGEKILGQALIVSEVEQLVAALMAGLHHESPDLTAEEVRSWLYPVMVGRAMKAVMAAWGVSGSSTETEDNSEQPDPPQGPKPN